MLGPSKLHRISKVNIKGRTVDTRLEWRGSNETSCTETSAQMAVHDEVREAAVDPMSRWLKYIKRPRLMHDESLTKSEKERPTAMRSCIKPNKHVDTFKDIRERKIGKPSIQPKVTKTHTSSARDICQSLAKSDSRKIIERSSSQPSSMNKVNPETMIAAPMMSKKSHGNSSRPSASHDDANDGRSMEWSTSCRIQGATEISSTSIGAGQMMLHHDEENQNALSSESADTPKEDTTWNEYLNLAYLYRRGAEIFTLDTLPPEEEWYKAVFAAQESLRKHRIASVYRCDNGITSHGQLPGSSNMSDTVKCATNLDNANH